MEDYFFPPVPPQSMQLERRFRDHAALLPENSRMVVFEVLSEAHPHFVTTHFEGTREHVKVTQKGRVIYFPSPLPMIKFSHILCGYERWLKRKYELPGFVEVEPGDTVIDCGGYVGGFSLSASAVADSVHIFEPGAANLGCIEANFAQSTNVVANHAGLYSENRLMRLNLSESSVEHSFLTPDDGNCIGSCEVPVFRLDDYCIEHRLGEPDFVKIEAEGVELEVFDGLGKLRPKKLAIDVSPEREGESPAEAFRERLADRGYEIRQRGHVMFARAS